MTLRSSVHILWCAARACLARLDRLLAEAGDSDDMIFDIRPGRDGWGSDNPDPRMIDPRKP
jgi:hypothetical protein